MEQGKINAWFSSQRTAAARRLGRTATGRVTHILDPKTIQRSFCNQALDRVFDPGERDPVAGSRRCRKCWRMEEV